jgi:type IV pilus assembly protein PilM
MVAVDLGGSGIRAAEFKTGKGAPVIGKVGYIALPPGAIEGGEVKDVEAVGNALKELWSREKFSSKQVVFGIANGNVLVRIKTLEWDVEADFRKSLKYQPGVAEDLSFDVDKANLDFHTLYEYMATMPDGSEKKMKSVLLVAAEKDMVDQFVDAIRAGGLHPVHADLTPFALIRSVNPTAHDDANDETVEVIIDMGLDVTNVILHQNGQPRFVRIVSGQAGRHLTQTLADQFNWSESDSERTKVELGLTGGVSADGQQHPAQQIINHVVSAFITEIRTSIDYFLSSTPQISSVSRVVLTGGGTNIKGLKERIASELRVPVEYGTPTQSVEAGKSVVIPEGLSESQLSVAYGLAMGTV